jgi:hypothetical protein
MSQPEEALKTLDEHEQQSLAVLVDTIIPRTDTPGASDAGVPRYINRLLTRDIENAQVFRAGLHALDVISARQFGTSFSELAEPSRLCLLSTISENPHSPAAEFLAKVKRHTVAAYYLSREGLCEELGWRGRRSQRRFQGCTHSKHGG